MTVSIPSFHRLSTFFSKQQNLLLCTFFAFIILLAYQSRYTSRSCSYNSESLHATILPISLGQHSSSLPGEIFSDVHLWSKYRSNKYGENEEDKNQDDEENDRIIEQRQWAQKVSNSPEFLQNLKPKRILVLDGFDTLYLDTGDLNCKGTRNLSNFEQKCQFFEEKWYTKLAHAPLFDFDAVVTIRNWEYKLYEGKLPESVQQVLVTFENPYVTRLADVSVNNAIFASYWRGSDVVLPWAKWIPFSSSNNSSVPFFPETIINSSDNTANSVSMDKNYAKGKTKIACIVVSDCEPEPPGSFNQRLKYVRELQRYIPVDIYGKCGNRSCGSDCFENLQRDYKFYLSFENANCRDYVTEKFHRNALKHDMVPVVLGAQKRDYDHVAPPNSFIFVEDFETPWQLASYLTSLHENDTAYNEYFRWKGKGEFIADPAEDLLCRICVMLHYQDFVPPKPWSPHRSTWKTLDNCLPPRRWYWNRPNS